MSTPKKSTSSIAKKHPNTALAKLIKRTRKKILFLKLKKKTHGHIKEVLEKNIFYTITHAKIETARYSFKTLIFVKPVNDEGITLKTYFLPLQTETLIDVYGYEIINIKQCPSLLYGIVFNYTGEKEHPSGSGNFYSDFNVVHGMLCTA